MRVDVLALALLAAQVSLARSPEPEALERRDGSEPFQRPRRLGFAAGAAKRARGFGQAGQDGAQVARRQLVDVTEQTLEALRNRLLGDDASVNTTSVNATSASVSGSRTVYHLVEATTTAESTEDASVTSTRPPRTTTSASAAPSGDAVDESGTTTTRRTTTPAAATSTADDAEVLGPASRASIRAASLASARQAAEAQITTSSSTPSTSATSSTSPSSSASPTSPSSSASPASSASAASTPAGVLPLVSSVLDPNVSSSASSSSSSPSSVSSAPSGSAASAADESALSSSTVTSAPLGAESSASAVEPSATTTSKSYNGILDQLGGILGIGKSDNATSATTTADEPASTTVDDDADLLTDTDSSASATGRVPYGQRTTPAANLTAPTFPPLSSEQASLESEVPRTTTSAPISSASDPVATGVLGNITAVVPPVAAPSAAANATASAVDSEEDLSTVSSTRSATLPIVGIPTAGANATEATTSSRRPAGSVTATELPASTASPEAPLPGLNETSSIVRPPSTVNATRSVVVPSSSALGENESTGRPVTTSAPAVSQNGTSTVAPSRPAVSSSIVLPGGSVNTTATATDDEIIPSATRNATVPVLTGASTANATSEATQSRTTSVPVSLNRTTSAVPVSTDAASSSATSSASSTRETPYEWVPTSTLMIAQSRSTTASSTESATDSSSGSVTTTAPDASALQQGASTSMVSGKPSVTITSQVAFPTNLPSRIVPDSFDDGSTTDDGTASTNALAQQDKETETTISILLDDSMPWEWVVENSDASGQIFYYVPIVVTSALNITLDQLQTKALQAYQTTSSTGESQILTVFLGSLPASYVDALSAMIQTPSSPIYSQPGLPGQLAQTFVSSFSVTSYSAESATSGDSSSGTTSAADAGAKRTDDGSNKSKTIIIAVVVTCGVLLIAIAGYLAFRATKSGAIALSSSPRMGERDFRDRDMMQAPGSGGLRGFYLNGGSDSWRGAGRRDSISTTSTVSTGFSGGSSSGGGGGGSSDPHRGFGHAASSSVDDRRSSWWRFSDSSSGAGHHHRGGAHDGMQQQAQIGLALGGTDTFRSEGPRRIQIVRGPDGAVSPAMIGRPVVQSNSLML
ncbi:hypothetical protein Rhopal_005795-T1 [Rhodotorula paludigena]|uniref:Mid2 domain-containing protein n=1 Tax=Rhodotorula paludigena TaxID=86838 RepID=A0AAV5GTQ7_9BASI|nr:hypothetical protein Rhopal_005795-T1 [Rhodotorula paludigena]